ncbi:sensory neuron membrane protein 1-like [Odontomachus brunneus]|uniref:sensory neuron membrane protein 1-like n=1 Tax=Odontomachus brunneus TaxID=486640 RepID=UPI0013F1CD35|nr:sensory neuron membrane protein 1-like [Odontomachus brunneus]XP_032687351.1 sensory neuron membrane protein 1-like [Odontomachus brunneus]
MVSIKKLGLAGLGTFFIGFINYNLGFPAILKSQVKSQVSLKKGTEMRDFWEKLPQPLHFAIYIFNVTNFNEIKSGAKPIVQELGPFHYDLYRDKENIVDQEEEDSVEYSLKQVWYFNREKSAMSDDVDIYSFHPVMLAIILIAQRDKPSAMAVISKAIDSIFKKPESIFIKTTVKELFFHGVYVDCRNITDFAGSAICTLLQEKDEMFIKEGDSIYKYGYLAKRNGTYLPDRIKVLRGIKNYEDVGRVLSLGNGTKMNFWSGSPCNDFRGTDGTIFPPFLSNDKLVWAHFPDICRSIAAYYVDPGKIKGFKTLHYTADLGDPSIDEDVRCLCRESDGCMPKNIFDAGPCLNVPIRISLPHLLNSDPHYYELIDGLKPDLEKHMMTFDFDPMTGTPLKAFKKIEFNVMIGPISKLKLMKSFPEALFPIFWVDDGIELGPILMKPLKVAYMQILIAKIVLWFMMLSGIGMMGVAGVKYYKEKNSNNVNMSPIPDTKQEGNNAPMAQTMTISTIPGVVPLSID